MYFNEERNCKKYREWKWALGGRDICHNEYNPIWGHRHMSLLRSKPRLNHQKLDLSNSHSLPLNGINEFLIFKSNRGSSLSKHVLCEGAANWQKEESEKENWIFIEAAKWNCECGTNGEQLQTQGNYFLAAGMEGARASFISWLFITDDRGDWQVSHTPFHTRSLVKMHKQSKNFNQSHKMFINEHQVRFSSAD